MTVCCHRTICPFYNKKFTAGKRRLLGALPPKRAQTRFESEVATLKPWQQPSRPATTASPVVLAPGEKRILSTFRTLDARADVLTPLAYAFIGGSLVGIPTTIISIGEQWQWSIPTLIWTGTTALLFFVASSGILKDKSLIAHEEVSERQAESVLPPLEPQRYEARGEVKLGQKTIYTRFAISDAHAWHEFCKAVSSGRAFSGTEAERHGLKREEFNRVLEQWTSLDSERSLVDPVSVGTRKTPRLTRGGKAMVSAFARTAP